MKAVQRAIARVINPALVDLDLNVPELYEDLQVRRAEAVYHEGVFEGFLFDLGIRPIPGGEVTSRYKFVRFLRLTRVAPISKDERGGDGPNMIDYQRDVLAALRQNGVHSVTLIANDPDRLGTMMCYGVQASGHTPEEARTRSSVGITSLKTCLSGSFRQIQIRPLNSDEVLWLNTNLAQWRHVAAFRGIPQPRKNISNSLTVTLNGMSRETTTEEQIEEFIRGLSDHSFLMMLIASPLSENAILRLLRRVSVELGRVASDVERTKTVSAGVALPIGFAGQLGTQEGIGSAAMSGENQGVSDSISLGQTLGESEGISTNFSESLSTSQSLSEGVTASQASSASEQASSGLAQGQTVGQSEGLTQSDSFGESENLSRSDSLAETRGVAQTLGRSETESQSVARSETVGRSDSFGFSQSQSVGQSSADSFSTNASRSFSETFAANLSQSGSLSAGEGSGISFSFGAGGSIIVASANASSSFSNNFNFGTAAQNSFGISTSGTDGESFGAGVSQTLSNSVTDTLTENQGVAISQTFGTTESLSRGVSLSDSVSQNFGQTNTTGISQGVGQNTNQTFGQNLGINRGASDTVSEGFSRGVGATEVASQSTTATRGVTEGTTAGQGTSQQVSRGSSETASQGTSQGVNRAQTASDSFAQTYGLGSSMGVAPSFSVSISKRLLDEEKRNLQGILASQRNRLMVAREEGAFAVHMYLVTPDESTKEAAVGLAKSAFWGTNENGTIPVPFHALNDLGQDEQEHLLEHLRTFSACTVPEPGQEALEDHAYSTVLIPSELAVITHPPRVDLPGIQVSLQAVPMFRIPVNADEALHIGRLVSGETGEPTNYRFGIDPDRITHTMVAGASGSGKTVTAFRLIYHWVNQPPRPVRVRTEDGSFVTEDRQPGAIILDWKSDFRSLANLVPQERFRYASLSDPDMGFRFNPLAVPAGVKPGTHRDTVCEMLAMAYGLGIRGRGIIYTDLHALFNMPRPVRYIDPTAPDDLMGTVYEYPELSRFVGMADLAVAINRRLDHVAENPRRYGNDVKDRLAVVVNRMQYYDWDGELVRIYTRDFHPDELRNNTFYGAEMQTYLDRGLLSTEPCLTLNEIVEGDNIVVLEGGGLDSLSKRGIIGLLSASIFNYARSRGDGAFTPEKLIVFEEAHEVIEGSTESMREIAGVGASIYEIMWNEGRSYGIRLLAICQTPSLMPPSVIANTSTFISHNLSVLDDLDLVTTKVGKDPRIDDRSFKQFMAMLPVGWAVIKSNGGRSYLENDPVLVSTSMLATVKPTNDQLIAQALRARRDD